MSEIQIVDECPFCGNVDPAMCLWDGCAWPEPVPEHPSSGASRHLLPPGEKEGGVS